MHNTEIINMREIYIFIRCIPSVLWYCYKMSTTVLEKLPQNGLIKQELSDCIYWLQLKESILLTVAQPGLIHQTIIQSIEYKMLNTLRTNTKVKIINQNWERKSFVRYASKFWQ